MKLSDNQAQNIIEEGKLLVCTADKNNQPRCIWVMPSLVENHRIIISNIQMKKTIENISENSKVFLNCYMPTKNDLQYKIVGKAKIENKGKLFDKIKTYEEENNLPPNLKVHSIIIVDILSVEESEG